MLLIAIGPSLVGATLTITPDTLPREDGEWVAFHVNMNVAGQVTTPVWTVKSVGKKDLADIKYRWIELQSKEEERNVITLKCLVAETEFGKGKNPLAHALQVFVKFGDQEPARGSKSIAAADTASALILARSGRRRRSSTPKSQLNFRAVASNATSSPGVQKSELRYRQKWRSRIAC